jgi:hypothetical protein
MLKSLFPELVPGTRLILPFCSSPLPEADFAWINREDLTSHMFLEVDYLT